MSERDLATEPALQRSGETDADGKRAVRLEIMLTEQMHDELIAAATSRRMPKTELARRCIEVGLYGWFGTIRRNMRGLDE